MLLLYPYFRELMNVCMAGNTTNVMSQLPSMNILSLPNLKAWILFSITKAKYLKYNYMQIYQSDPSVNLTLTKHVSSKVLGSESKFKGLLVYGYSC